ncbi:hypothetical protein AOLI_G00299550 [Acnodon oligacanthus]
MKNKHHIFSQLHSDTRLLTASHVGRSSTVSVQNWSGAASDRFISSEGSAVAAGSNRTDICRRLAWQRGRASAEGKRADRVTETKGDDGQAGNRRAIHMERLAVAAEMVLEQGPPWPSVL